MPLLIQVLILCICYGLYNSIDVSIDIGLSSFPIRGVDLKVLGKTIYNFKKVPYAKPPIGDKRFRYPEELDYPPWTGTYDSTIAPPTCWQGSASSDFDLYNPAANMWYSKIPMNEDCLYLSIWTPAIGITQNLPVMIWIYGGSYMSGSSSLEVYDGSILASLYSVIIVSFQFRVGPFGFLFFDDTESPGNQALMDQRMALQWINKNINKFGGNPNTITIFAESSGATSLSLHTFSPLTTNLFQRVIFESGTLLTPWAIESPAAALSKAKYIAIKGNCSSYSSLKSINCLRNLKPQQLIDLNFLIRNQIASSRMKKLQNLGYNTFYSDAALFFDIYFRPIFDENFISQDTIEQIIQGNLWTKKEVLLGTNANEALYFLIYGLSGYFDFFNGSTVQIPKNMNFPSTNFVDPYKILLENILDLEYLYPPIAEFLLYEYNISSKLFDDDSWSSVNVIRKFDLLAGDTQFICPTIQFADSITKMDQTKVYMYVFNVSTSQMPLPNWVGVMHGYEIEYVFGMPWSSDFTSKYYSFTDEEKKVSNIVMSMWTNFAKYGNPTPDGTATNGKLFWPLYTIKNKQYLKISKETPSKLQVGLDYKSKECKLWTKMLPRLKNTLVTISNESQTMKTIWLLLVFCWMGRLVIVSLVEMQA